MNTGYLPKSVDTMTNKLFTKTYSYIFTGCQTISCFPFSVLSKQRKYLYVNIILESIISQNLQFYSKTFSKHYNSLLCGNNRIQHIFISGVSVKIEFHCCNFGNEIPFKNNTFLLPKKNHRNS